MPFTSLESLPALAVFEDSYYGMKIMKELTCLEIVNDVQRGIANSSL